MLYTNSLTKLLSAFCDNAIECKQNEPMSDHTGIRTGGLATLAVWPNSRRQLIQVLDLWREWGDSCPICVIGNGSHVLFLDKGYHGLVVITNRANRVVFEEDEALDRNSFRKEFLYCQIYAECGASLSDIAFACVEDGRSLSGLEFACGLPDTVGGATVMNVRSYGSDMERVMVASEYYDLTSGEIIRLRDDDMNMDWDSCIYQEHPEWVVLDAVMVLSYGDANDIRERMEQNMNFRQRKHPCDYPNTGEIFKRPQDNFAGRLIEDAGLKGYSIGGAQVSVKHAGFIINRGDATSEEVMDLIRYIQQEVERAFEVRLACRLRYFADNTALNHGDVL